jgi:hypothetical protein
MTSEQAGQFADWRFIYGEESIGAGSTVHLHRSGFGGVWQMQNWQND